MIVLITTRGNGYTMRSLVDGTFGVAAPKFRVTHYERLLRSWLVPRATYLFGDLERLAPWELQLAADLYRSMTAAGLRCLNNPALAMTRVQLLTRLRTGGINPFGVFRADAEPRPERFPVFIRSENDHARAPADLYDTQEQLDEVLARMGGRGLPLRGMLVVEQVAEAYADNLWAKWGTWRIGDRMIVEHIAVDDNWLVKTGDHAKLTDAAELDEHDAVTSNRFVEDLRPPFDIGKIDYGRADHGRFAGRTVVYEINTNPYLGWYSPGRRPIRRATQIHARTAIADALAAIDTDRGGWVKLPPSAARRPIRWWRPGFTTPRRP